MSLSVAFLSPIVVDAFENAVRRQKDKIHRQLKQKRETRSDDPLAVPSTLAWILVYISVVLELLRQRGPHNWFVSKIDHERPRAPILGPAGKHTTPIETRLMCSAAPENTPSAERART